MAIGRSYNPPFLLPCVERNPDAPLVLSDEARQFAYEGRALTAQEFAAYISTYDIGTIPPDYVVIHNTAIPDASWARYRTDGTTWWDRDEVGLSEAAIKNKRNKQLDGIRDYYKSLGWQTGPHLFIDERWIWLFTPLRLVGTHAKEGNSYTSGGRLHYSVGVEMIGHFARSTFHAQQSALLRSALTAIRNRWKTFDFVYKSAPLNRPDLHKGGISLHRNYNKPSCPAVAITPEYLVAVLNAKPPVPPENPPPSLPAPDGKDILVSEPFLTLYRACGGFARLGFALTPEQRVEDCVWLRCERGVLKVSARYGGELALLSEAKERGWL
jgi:hypothetical protein